MPAAISGLTHHTAALTRSQVRGESSYMYLWSVCLFPNTLAPRSRVAVPIPGAELRTTIDYQGPVLANSWAKSVGRLCNKQTNILLAVSTYYIVTMNSN